MQGKYSDYSSHLMANFCPSPQKDLRKYFLLGLKISKIPHVRPKCVSFNYKLEESAD